MELLILTIGVLIIIIIAQWGRFNALVKRQQKVIADLELDNAFWLNEASYYAREAAIKSLSKKSGGEI